MARLARHHGGRRRRPHPPEFLKTFGLRNDAIIPQWIPSATPEQINQIADAKEQLYRRLVRERGLEPLPGARHWTERLALDGWLQAIASFGSARKCRRGAHRHRPRALLPGHRLGRGCHARQARSPSFSRRRRAPRLHPRSIRGCRRCSRRHPGRPPRRNAQHRSPPQSAAPPRRLGRHLTRRPPSRRLRPPAENEAMTRIRVPPAAFLHPLAVTSPSPVRRKRSHHPNSEFHFPASRIQLMVRSR